MATQRGRDYRNATQWTPHCVAIALLDHTDNWPPRPRWLTVEHKRAVVIGHHYVDRNTENTQALFSNLTPRFRLRGESSRGNVSSTMGTDLN